MRPLGTTPTDIPDPTSSRAVLIGIHKYRHLDSLPSVARGVTRLKQLLQEPSLWGLPADHIATLGPRASPETVLKTIRDAALAATDTLVLYFAGHGLRRTDGRPLHLALTGADPDHIQIGTVSYAYVREMLAVGNTRRKLEILDCCYSGLAAKGTMGAGPSEVDPSSALGFDDAHRGHHVLTSASANEPSFARPHEQYPEFTGELIKVLESGIPGAGATLTPGEVWGRIHAAMSARPHSTLPRQLVQNAVQDLPWVRNRAYTPASFATHGTAPRPVAPSPAPLPQPGRPSRPLLRRRVLTYGGVAAVAAIGGASYTLLEHGPGGVRKPGAQRWRRHFTSMGIPLPAEPGTPGRGALLLPLDDGRVVCLDSRDGGVLWQVDLGGALLTRSSIVKGCLLVSLAIGPGQGRLVALDHKGTTLWSAETNGWPWAQQSGPNGRVFVATSSGWVYRLNLVDGRPDFARKVAGQANAVVVANNYLYVPTFGDGIVVLDAATGESRWSRPAEGSVCGAEADTDIVYLTIGNREPAKGGRLRALDAQYGDTHWEFTFDTLVQAAPTLAPEHVLVPDGRGTLHAFDPVSGTRTWQQDIDANLSDRVTHDGRTVYVGTSRGIAALSLAGGRILWSKDILPTPPTASYGGSRPVIDDDTVYLGYGDLTTESSNYDVYAFSR
ncbi:PQQ-binding-like beta-propeller repeat protein [Embleya sp. NPDC005971]|uniref:caspase, EACC1-associated type n=1 Tax=Embleya sp. NPDC005971 TaxID=3156724 RepID=UPI00340837A7